MYTINIVVFLEFVLYNAYKICVINLWRRFKDTGFWTIGTVGMAWYNVRLMKNAYIQQGNKENKRKWCEKKVFVYVCSNFWNHKGVWMMTGCGNVQQENGLRGEEKGEVRDIILSRTICVWR